MVDLRDKHAKKKSRHRHASARADTGEEADAVTSTQGEAGILAAHAHSSTQPSTSSHSRRSKRIADATVAGSATSVADNVARRDDDVAADEENWASNQARIESVCATYPNNICNDCGEHGTHWAVVNWGVFVCIRCSGVHRSLGSHISKVKSTTMDRWRDVEVRLMMAMGNQRAKSVLEAHLLAAEQQGVQAPMRGGSTSNEELHRFIVKKYVDGAFAVDDWHRVLRRLYKQVGYHQHGSSGHHRHSKDDTLNMQHKQHQTASSSGNIDPHTAAPAHATDRAEPNHGKGEETLVSAAKAQVNSSASMKSFYGYDVAVRPSAASTEAAKKTKKKTPKIVHGTFGIVNVPEEEYETRLTQLLQAFEVTGAVAVAS